MDKAAASAYRLAASELAPRPSGYRGKACIRRMETVNMLYVLKRLSGSISRFFWLEL
jgi:hypothetical protein